MTVIHNISSYVQMAPLVILIHAIDQYSKRVTNARSIKEQVYLETSLKGLKEAIIVYYN